MDPLTHFAIGATLGTTQRTTHLPLPALMLTGGIAACFPDLDIFFKFLPVSNIYLQHRGITHSLYLIPLFAALCAGMLAISMTTIQRRFMSAQGLGKFSIKHIYWLCCLGILSHILADLLTTWGTYALMPFDNSKQVLGSVKITSIGIALLAIAGSGLALMVKSHTKLIGTVALSFMLSYTSIFLLLPEIRTNSYLAVLSFLKAFG